MDAATSLSPGRLDRRIAIERNEPTRNAEGDDVDNWVEVARRWASRRDAGGREFFTADRDVARAASVFRFYHVRGLGGAMRLREVIGNEAEASGAIWNIRLIKEIGRRVGHEVVAEADDRPAP